MVFHYFLRALVLLLSGGCAIKVSQASSGRHRAEICREDTLPDGISILQLGTKPLRQQAVSVLNSADLVPEFVSDSIDSLHRVAEATPSADSIVVVQVSPRFSNGTELLPNSPLPGDEAAAPAPQAEGLVGAWVAKQYLAGLGAEDRLEHPGSEIGTKAYAVVSDELPGIIQEANATLADDHPATSALVGPGGAGSLGLSAEDAESVTVTIDSQNVAVSSMGSKTSGAHDDASSYLYLAQAWVARAHANLSQSGEAMVARCKFVSMAAFRQLQTVGPAFKLLIMFCLLVALGVASQLVSSCIGSRQKKNPHQDNDPLGYLYASRAVEARRAMSARA